MNAKKTGIDPAEIARRREAGESVSEIATRLGVSPRRVYQVLGSRKRGDLTDDQVADIRRRHRLGDSVRQIAADLAISRKMVDRFVDGEPKPAAAPLTAEETAHIQVRTAAGRSPAEIARELGRSLAGVRKVADDLLAEQQEADWIRDAIVQRVQQLGGLPAHRIMQMTGGRVSDDHISAFLGGRKGMGSRLLQHVLAALGGSIAWEK